MTRAERREVEQAIQTLIDLLDAADGDCDLEPEEDAEHDGQEPPLATLYGSWDA